MSLKLSKISFPFLVLILAIAGQGCSTSQNINPVGDAPLITVAPATEELSPSTPARLSTLAPTIEAAASPTLPSVTITAVNGNLSIRSGPDPVFDAIALLKNGETLPVSARSVLDGWVEVPVPGQEGQKGWVSIKTPYSKVSGYVLDLPEIMTVEWPTGSYIRNCTGHRMLVEPFDRQLSSVGDSPQNRAWFPPGVYTIHDLDLADQPYVMTIKLTSHTQVDIRKDGSRQSWTCPGS